MDFTDIFRGVEKELDTRIDKVEQSAVKKINSVADEQVEKIQALLSTGAKLEVTTNNSVKTVTGLKHKQLKQLIQVVGQRIPILMVGMAGTGKTHAAEQVAEALNIPFYAMSVGAQTSKSDILGFIHAGGEYVPTLFRKSYENGGVFLMDELDAGNANVLIQVNAALSNNYCAFPDGMVKRHKDFAFIATANTYGNGANRQYVGRNQLDAATLDRFAILDWKIDETLEKSLVSNYQYGEQWHEVVKDVRKYVSEQGMRVLVTPRTTLRGVMLINTGFSLEDTIHAALLNSVPQDKQSEIKNRLLNKWGKDTVIKLQKSEPNNVDKISTETKLVPTQKTIKTRNTTKSTAAEEFAAIDEWLGDNNVS